MFNGYLDVKVVQAGSLFLFSCQFFILVNLYLRFILLKATKNSTERRFLALMHRLGKNYFST